MNKILAVLMVGILILTGCSSNSVADVTSSINSGSVKYSITVPGKMMSQYKLKDYTESAGIQGTSISFSSFDITSQEEISKLSDKSKTVMLTSMPFSGDLESISTEDLGDAVRELDVNGKKVSIYEIADEAVKMSMLNAIYIDEDSQTALLIMVMATNVNKDEIGKYFDQIVQSIKIEKSSSTESNSLITEISLEAFKEMIDRKEDFVFYLGSSTCSACISYKPVVEEYIKTYNQPIYYLDVDFAFKSGDDVVKFYKEYLNINTPLTPTTAVVKAGKAVNSLEGRISIDDLVKLIKGE